MSFKSFYVHSHQGSIKLSSRLRRGFTCLVRPVKDEEATSLEDSGQIPSRMCAVQLAFCSAEDHFCRKTGRSCADAKAPVFVNKRDLPYFIAKAENQLYRDDLTQVDAFLYLLKYVI